MFNPENEINQDYPERNFGVKEDPDWKSLRLGDIKALEVLFKKYYHSLINYGLRFTHDKEVVDDCIQTLFLTIWERKDFIGPTSSAKHYLLASLRRLLLKNNTDNLKLITLDEELNNFQIAFSPESEIINQQTESQMIQLLQHAIHQLPARQKEALFLKYYEDKSFQEISLIMNISPRAVYKLIYKAMDNLSKELKPKVANTHSLFYFLFL
jgi:RNA polymerase sigma factor (sigma-70 family)